MKHFASADFWEHSTQLPEEVQELADKNYALLKENAHHPSLRFRRVGAYWSVRVGLRYRALAVELPEGMLWFWIGTHAEYDRLVQGNEYTLLSAARATSWVSHLRST